MEQRPEQPPEGKLIADAAARLDLSIREAARRAGISYGRWRQIVTGYQTVSSGVHAPVHAPAKTVAKMAAVVGITPGRMETEGQRPDVAEAMRQQHDRRVVALPAAAGLTTPAGYLRPDLLEKARPYAEAIWARYGALLDQGIPDPDGAQMFGPGEDAADWNRFRESGFSVRDRSWLLGALQEGTESARDRGTGLAAPIPGSGDSVTISAVMLPASA